jgi:hypothetical protein
MISGHRGQERTLKPRAAAGGGSAAIYEPLDHVPSHPMPSHRGRRCGGHDRTPPIHQTHHATLSNLLPVAAVCRTSTSPVARSLLLAPGPAPSRQRCRCLPVAALSRPGRLWSALAEASRSLARWPWWECLLSHTAIWLQKKIRTGAVAVNSVKNATSQEQQ